MPARNAHVSTARTPPIHDVGPVHDVHTSPLPSLGTRPLAIAPAIIPRKNGVISDEAANTMPWSCASRAVAENLRKAKAPPRSTMPPPTSSQGMNNVVMIAPNASGKPVQRKTRM